MSGKPTPTAPTFTKPAGGDSDAGLWASGPTVGSSTRGPRTVQDVSRDLTLVKDRLLEHVEDGEHEHARAHLAAIERLVKERTLLMEAKKASEKAERAVMARFQSRRPNAHVIEAERDLMRVAGVNSAKGPVKEEFVEALWSLHVAYGYATARAMESSNAIDAYRAQVIELLDEMASDPTNPGREAPLRAAIRRVRALMLAPPSEMHEMPSPAVGHAASPRAETQQAQEQ